MIRRLRTSIRRHRQTGPRPNAAVVGAALFVATIIGIVQPGVSAGEPVSSDATDAVVSENELVELGETLKAAVLSGALSEADAFKIYMSLEERMKPDRPKVKGDSAGDDKTADGPYAAKDDYLRLNAPQPGDVTMLLQPEFLRRDLERLGRELDLDRDQMAVADVLIADYLESYELVTAPLREAIARYQRSRTDQWIAATLARVEVGDVEDAVARTREAIRQFEAAVDRKVASGETKPREGDDAGARKEATRSLWAQRMIVVTATMEQRLGELHQRVEDRLTEMERTGAPTTADDLVRTARELRVERRHLYASLTETLSLVAGADADEAERTRFELALARVRVEHDLRRGRIGGETMNLWSALAEVSADLTTRYGHADRLPAAEHQLADEAPRLAASLDTRTEATLDREIHGLAYQAHRDRLGDADPARLTTAMQPFADAARRELTASIAVRDELVALLEATSILVETAYPDTDVAITYRDAALRRGFRTEMRRQWSERALAAAARVDGLDDDARAALDALAQDTTAALRTMRDEAIANRLRRDPERALAQIEMQLETPAPDRKMLVFWDELLHDLGSYADLDRQTEARLAAILTPERMAAIPPRPRPIKTVIRNDGKKQPRK